MTLLPLAYLGNVQYFTKLCFEDAVIDLREHYVKQSYRTRCDILGPAGVVTLSVPVVKSPNDRKAAMGDVRIDYSKRWRHNHRQALLSAYKGSPYFDYYFDAFEPFYIERYELLADFNLGLTRLALRLLGYEPELRFAENYLSPEAAAAQGHADFRSSLSPKPRLWRPDPAFAPRPYYQLFADKHRSTGCVVNLSIVDLLFCEGPGAAAILRESSLL